MSLAHVVSARAAIGASPARVSPPARASSIARASAPAGTRYGSSFRGAARRRGRGDVLARAGDDDAAAAAPPADPADARAALLAKAAAYKKAAQQDSAQMGGKTELESVVSEAVRRVETGETKPSDETPRQSQVRVKIMTRDADYNPFDEDEQVVGFEENNRVYTPEGAAGWTRGEKSVFADMLDAGRRRERGVGVDNDVEEVVTRTTFDDERYRVKKTSSASGPSGARLSDEKPTDLAQQVLDEAAEETADVNGEAPRAARGDEEAYKPKVSTWGVFPRPDNISKTYGGGKTIKAGEFVAETEEEKEARRARVRQKLNKYREDAGITVDNGTRVRWNGALGECQTLMRLGRLVEARELLEPIVLEEEINPRTQLGGEITFHYAMCLDNTQRRDEALEMYKRCVGNPHGQVSKQADRMIWGMTTASTKMKADQFDYDAIKDKYDPFLIKMTTERQDWKIETDPEEEAALARVTAGAIAAVMAIPVAFGVFLFAR